LANGTAQNNLFGANRTDLMPRLLAPGDFHGQPASESRIAWLVELLQRISLGEIVRRLRVNTGEAAGFF
jgi:hypothetical protein